jgi:sugar phosphate isomerase/epimerase
MTKLGFVSAILPDLSFNEVISFASENGFSCVELMCWPVGKADRRYAGVTHLDVSEIDEKEIKSIRNTLKEKNVSISGLGYYPNPLTSEKEKSAIYFDHIKKVIDASARLEIGIMNTFIGADHTKHDDENLDRFRDLWPPVVRYAEDRNVKIAIENCPMFFTKNEWPAGNNLAHSPALWRKIFEIIPSKNFRLNYDPSHLLWQMMDYVRPIYEFKDRIFHVHIKDAKVYRDKLNEVGILATPLQFHTPKLPGLGDIEWSEFFSALSDINYKGNAVIEVEDKAYEESLETRKMALIQSKNYLRQFISQ